nr:glutamine-synthetase adenylyltransferase [Pseudomonadota bacterium]
TALGAAYELLRTIEHRVQMIDDRQTHVLPAGPALDGVARLHGLVDGAALLDLLRPHVEATGAIYDALDSEEGEQLSRDRALLGQRLAGAGFANPDESAEMIERWRGGAYPALRSPAAREALEAVLPGLIDALGAAPDPHGAIVKLDLMLSRLPSAINFFRLIEARPPLARLLGAILSHAPTLADALARRPALFDGLVDATALDPVGDVAALIAEMGERSDYQARLDHVRRLVGEKRFALGVQIVAGVSDPLDVSAGYARVAEAAIGVLADATIAEFEQAHGRVPGSELVILALGRLGGGALTHASDLDLIYVFTGDHMAESDGVKPIGAVHYYNRLAQRITVALSVATASGPLYEIDTRLRPSGTQGPLSVSLDGFARYQRESAWAWEHMALTRARCVFGASAARAATQAVIDDVLAGNRPARNVAADATAMRAEMAAHKPPKGPLDAKLLPGGLVDLEFAVHVTQLTRHAGFDPHLRRAIDLLVTGGLAPPAMTAAHDVLTRLLVTLRLVAPDAEPPGDATRALIARALEMEDWPAVMASLEVTRYAVTAYLAQVTQETSDGEC